MLLGGLSEIENDHEDPDEQQNPAQPDDNPGDLLGGPGKNHEDRQQDHEPQGIDECIGECDPGEYLLKRFDDPQADLMGKKIKERKDVVDDSVQMLQIRRFLREEDIHGFQASLADRMALLGWNKARI
jgi:hypothetical protein